jgi:putative glutamine amidotransferase
MKQKISIAKPIIGISSSLLTIDSGSFLGYERLFVGYDYIEGIVQAGGIPLVLPVIEEESVIVEQMKSVQGLLLSGGYDVSPHFYGEEPTPGLEAVNQKRDIHEMQLIRHAHQAGKPIFGICRGMQLLNVAFGGTLYQDIQSSIPHPLQHLQKTYPHVATHQVEVVKDSLLHQLLNQEVVSVNSYHHQTIKTVAPSFLINARSKDGIIEGIENRNGSFICGVQWHPEMMFKKSALMFKLFEGFVQAVKNSLETA